MRTNKECPVYAKSANETPVKTPTIKVLRAATSDSYIPNITDQLLRIVETSKTIHCE